MISPVSGLCMRRRPRRSVISTRRSGSTARSIGSPTSRVSCTFWKLRQMVAPHSTAGPPIAVSMPPRRCRRTWASANSRGAVADAGVPRAAVVDVAAPRDRVVAPHARRRLVVRGLVEPGEHVDVAARVRGQRVAAIGDRPPAGKRLGRRVGRVVDLDRRRLHGAQRADAAADHRAPERPARLGRGGSADRGDAAAAAHVGLERLLLGVGEHVAGVGRKMTAS